MSIPRIFVFLGALNGLFSVALGAFGAHALKGHIDPGLLAAYEKASHYQGMHALGLLLIGLLGLQRDDIWIRCSGWLLLAGILLFSGSLYAMALSNVRELGIITPAGGISFILGWFCLCVAALRWR